MNHISKFDDFINERFDDRNDYAVGDIVSIRYSLTGDITPVKIIAKKSHNYFIVSHKIKNSFLQNAPDHGIKKSEIIGRISGVGDAINTNDRRLENPTFQPNVSGMIATPSSFQDDNYNGTIPSIRTHQQDINSGVMPGRGSYSNDISF